MGALKGRPYQTVGRRTGVAPYFRQRQNPHPLKAEGAAPKKDYVATSGWACGRDEAERSLGRLAAASG